MSVLKVFTVEELKDVLDKHVSWLKGIDAEKPADLRNANLSNADLSYANLRYADLSSANLRNANLSNANLSNANLRNANLSYANLSYADLSYANLSYADLSSANLRNANLLLIGQDIRGYLFYGFRNELNVLVIRAGCREFTGIAAARSHWLERHLADEILHEDILSLVDRAERMAKVRGWKLE